LNDFYLIAEVQDFYSHDGSVIIKSFSDFSDRFFELNKVIIDFFGKPKELVVEFANMYDKLLVLKFNSINSNEDAQFLIGKKLYITKDKLYSLPEDTFYIHDLIDSDVYFENLFFGKLIDVLNLPGNDVYVIVKNNGDEIMIPAVRKFILKFNLQEKKMYLDSKCKIFFEDEN
jgi:16S rRNA processing protein RimM